MEQVTCSGALLFLALLSQEDIREKQVSAKKIFLFGLLAVIFRMVVSRKLVTVEVIYGLIPGIFLLFLSIVSKESIGTGDGMAVAVLGLWMGIWRTFLILCGALIMIGVFALISLLKKRKEPIPFIPFLLLGMEVLLLYA